MKSMKMGLCALVSFFSLSSFAQTAYTPPMVFECQADCFALNGRDGATLEYSGKHESGEFFTSEEAFRDLQESCGDGLLVIRKLQGTLTNAQRKKVNETQSSSSYDSTSHYHRGGYYYYYPESHSSSSSSSSTKTSSYQIIDYETRAVFQFNEATEANSCKRHFFYDNGIYIDSQGNRARG